MRSFLLEIFGRGSHKRTTTSREHEGLGSPLLDFCCGSDFGGVRQTPGERRKNLGRSRCACAVRRVCTGPSLTIRRQSRPLARSEPRREHGRQECQQPRRRGPRPGCFALTQASPLVRFPGAVARSVTRAAVSASRSISGFGAASVLATRPWSRRAKPVGNAERT
jgi:hypothetical protein